MKKNILLLLSLVLMPFLSSAQDSFVKWQTQTNHIEGDLYQIVLDATIDEGWHMYDMGPYDLMGPNATIIEITEDTEGAVADGAAYQLDTPVKVYEPLFKIDIGYFEGHVRFAQNVRLDDKKATVKLYTEWMICNDMTCLPLTDSTFTINIDSSKKYPKAVSSDTATVEAKGGKSSGSLWALILEAILWGFAALLTPCVFPMIPMTISFFMKDAGSPARARFRALMYGLFIILLYTLPIAIIILVTRIVGGDAVTADIFNWLATNWIPNILFFIVFMVFAASFFGAFEITLPSKLVNKSDEGADKKGLAGLFFMALTLVLVSFSCTGPIVGTVLIKSTQGEFWEPIITMLAFSVAFALPFTIFAMFPSLLKKVPKSGGWLNSVKVVLGFIEVALGFKFLSVADQTYHWGLLDREVYLAIWIVTFTLLGFYLLGKLRFKHDDEINHIGVPRLALSIIVFTFVVYMIPGMWGAPLKALSGYLPPITTQDFVINSGSNTVVITEGEQTSKSSNIKYSDFLHLPHNLEGYFELNEGLAAAKAAGKPAFVDVTGHGCVNCREMEARVWSDPRVLKLLREDYVIIALYTDDKKRAEESDWVTNEKGDVLKHIGRINSYICRTRFGVNAQPNYVLLNDEGEMMMPPRGYDLDVNGFVDFLEEGLKLFKENK